MRYRFRVASVAMAVVVVAPSTALGVLAAPAEAAVLGCVLPGTEIPCLDLLEGTEVPVEVEGVVTAAGAGAGAIEVAGGVIAFAGGVQLGYGASCWIKGLFGGDSCPSIGDALGITSDGGGQPTTSLGANGLLQKLDGPTYIFGDRTARFNFSIPYPDDGYHQNWLAVYCKDAIPGTASSYGFNLSYPSGYLDPGNYTASVGGEAATGVDAACKPASGSNAEYFGGADPWYVSEVKVMFNGARSPSPADWRVPAPPSAARMDFTVHCVKGGTEATYTQRVEAVEGVRYQLPSQSCESVLPGSHVGTLTATGQSTGGSVTVTAPTYSDPAKAAYPLCTTAGSCVLDLRRQGHSCFDGVTICKGWMDDESSYQCDWIDPDTLAVKYLVPIDWCETKWPHTFDGEIIPAGTTTGPDGQPTATPTPTPTTSTTVAPGGDPGTSPATSGSTTVAPGGDPGTSGQTSATPGAGGFPTTGTNPGGADPDPLPGTSGSSCMAGAWSWNPVNWVLTPIKCALIWAFVPSPGALRDFTTSVKGAYDGTAIGEWAGAISGIGQGLSVPSGGCGGVLLRIPQLGDLHTGNIDEHIFGTCDEPWATMSGIVKAFITMAIIWACGVVIFRNIASAFGYDAKIGAGV